MKRFASKWMALMMLSIPLACFAADPPIAAKASCKAKGDQVKFLSDVPGDPYGYLEALQRNIYSSNEGLADQFAKSELNSPRSVASIAELKARAVKACPDPSKRDTCALDPQMVEAVMGSLACQQLPTRFESPLFFALISLHLQPLEKAQKWHHPKAPATRFGSLPTGTFDAQAILPPGSDVPLVILNRDLFFFSGAFSKAISDAIPITTGQAVALDYSPDGIRKRLLANTYIVTNFADAAARLVKGGSSAGAREVTLDETHNHLHARLLGAIDSFLMAHEQAHVILGHTGKASVSLHLAGGAVPAPTAAAKAAIPSASGATTSDSVIQVISRSRQQELDADALGFKLMMYASQEGKDPIATLVGAAAPHMVFRVLEMADRYGKEAGGWTFADANHPSASERVKALEPVFDVVAKSIPILKQADFRIAFDSAFDVLLQEADSQIRQRLGLAVASSK
jgi:hypothetical protein